MPRKDGITAFFSSNLLTGSRLNRQNNCMDQGLDLIELLNIEYQRRCEKNKSYSLRAYARDLSVQPATLSHIMRRKRPPAKRLNKKSMMPLNYQLNREAI